MQTRNGLSSILADTSVNVSRAGDNLTFADLVLAPFTLREYILKEHRGLDDNLLSPEYRGKYFAKI